MEFYIQYGTLAKWGKEGFSPVFVQVSLGTHLGEIGLATGNWQEMD
jgi:hypothetical protein